MAAATRRRLHLKSVSLHYKHHPLPTPTSTTTIKKIKSSFSLNCLHPLPPTIFSSCQIHQCTHCGNRCGKSREGGTQVFKRIVVWCTHPSQLSLSFLISHPLLGVVEMGEKGVGVASVFPQHWERVQKQVVPARESTACSH